MLGHRESPQPDGRPVFTPRIGFTTPNGTRHEFLGQVTAPVKRFVERAAVPVVYREAEPDQARIDTFVDNWLGASVALGLALLSALAALMLVRSAQRELRR